MLVIEKTNKHEDTRVEFGDDAKHAEGELVVNRHGRLCVVESAAVADSNGSWSYSVRRLTELRLVER